MNFLHSSILKVEFYKPWGESDLANLTPEILCSVYSMENYCNFSIKKERKSFYIYMGELLNRITGSRKMLINRCFFYSKFNTSVPLENFAIKTICRLVDGRS